MPAMRMDPGDGGGASNQTYYPDSPYAPGYTGGVSAPAPAYGDIAYPKMALKTEAPSVLPGLFDSIGKSATGIAKTYYDTQMQKMLAKQQAAPSNQLTYQPLPRASTSPFVWMGLAAGILGVVGIVYVMKGKK